MSELRLAQPVTHQLYGNGTVVDVDNGKKLVTAFFDNLQCYKTVHPVSLTPADRYDTVET